MEDGSSDEDTTDESSIEEEELVCSAQCTDTGAGSAPLADSA